MSRAPQPELQLGYWSILHEFVDAQPQVLAAEAGELREQRRRADLDGELAVAAAEHAAVRALRLGQDLLQRRCVRALAAFAPRLLDDVPQQIAGMSWFGHCWSYPVGSCGRW